MPHVHNRRRVPGDPRHGTRWADPVERETAALALGELQVMANRIALVPAPRQSHGAHMVRVQESANPAWYRDFVHGRWSRRGCDVKRSRVERALRRVADDGVVRRNGYETRLLALLSERRHELGRGPWRS